MKIDVFIELKFKLITVIITSFRWPFKFKLIIIIILLFGKSLNCAEYEHTLAIIK